MLNYPASHIAIDLVGILKALSQPTRLRIFDLLMEGVQCNCEIAEKLELSLSLISHHMRILREAGLVEGERDSQDERWIYYSVNRETLSTVGPLLQRLLDLDRIQPRSPACGPKRCSPDSS